MACVARTAIPSSYALSRPMFYPKSETHPPRTCRNTIFGTHCGRWSVVVSIAQLSSCATPWRKLLVNGDPMDLIEIEKIVSPTYDLNNQRDRILSPDEIRELRDIFIRM